MQKSIFPKTLAWFVAALLAAVLTGCAARDHEVSDLARLPQSPTWYQARVHGANWGLKPGYQAGLAREWHERWFEPWLQPDFRAGWEQIKTDGERFLANLGIGENLLAREEPYYGALIENCSWQNYPNGGWKGITRKNANLRLLPSARPTFSSDKPGEGFPFDRLQQTSLPPNTPIYVHHHSKDRAWLLVQSPLAWGWLEADQAARMSEAQIEQWTTAKLLTITRDESVVLDLEGHYVFKASMGTALPLAGEEDDHWLALVASRDYKGRAVLHTAWLEKQSAALFPLALSAHNLAQLADGIMGQNYGWGGLYGNRDCSAALRDLFAPFGLWLPRNSFDQAHQVGTFYDLKGLDAAQKKQAILDHGIPFLSLIWMPGHIMLYVGAPQGEPLIMHNIWGLRTNTGNGIIGRMVITSLEPGRERADLVRPEGLLIHRVEGLTLLAPASALQDNR